MSLPEIRTHDDWRIERAKREQWIAPLAAIALRHGLPAPTLSDLQSAGDIVAFAGERHVLKLTAPLFRAEQLAERAVLAALSGSVEVGAPELVATGELEGWPYMVLSRIRGVPAAEVWPDLAELQRAEVLRAALRVSAASPVQRSAEVPGGSRSACRSARPRGPSLPAPLIPFATRNPSVSSWGSGPLVISST